MRRSQRTSRLMGGRETLQLPVCKEEDEAFVSSSVKAAFCGQLFHQI